MNLRNDKRQKNQLALNLSLSSMGEAQQAGKQAAESRQATHEPQSPATCINSWRGYVSKRI